MVAVLPPSRASRAGRPSSSRIATRRADGPRPPRGARRRRRCAAGGSSVAGSAEVSRCASARSPPRRCAGQRLEGPDRAARRRAREASPKVAPTLAERVVRLACGRRPGPGLEIRPVRREQANRPRAGLVRGSPTAPRSAARCCRRAVIESARRLRAGRGRPRSRARRSERGSRRRRYQLQACRDRRLTARWTDSYRRSAPGGAGARSSAARAPPAAPRARSAGRARARARVRVRGGGEQRVGGGDQALGRPPPRIAECLTESSGSRRAAPSGAARAERGRARRGEHERGDERETLRWGSSAGSVRATSPRPAVDAAHPPASLARRPRPPSGVRTSAGQPGGPARSGSRAARR